MRIIAGTVDEKLSQIIVDAGRYIRSCQQSDGAILWFADGKLDPWDHTEAAMGLSISGDLAAAKKALCWLWQNQNSDGSWYAKYYGSETDADLERHKIESNFVAYPACGLWHYYLISGDYAFVEQSFSCVEKAMNFVIALQTSEGDIQWAISEKETLAKDALVTACSSILRSMECAIHLADVLGRRHAWRGAYLQLARALKNKPWRFDRSWVPKTRFSMDWFYPILAGIYSPVEARLRIDTRWSDFVHPQLGCRCVSDEPWITVAESCELTLALLAAQQSQQARKVFESLWQWQDHDGGFWTGYSFRDRVIWPREKTSWTAAAILLAADALKGITPAASLFTTPSQLFFPEYSQGVHLFDVGKTPGV